MALSLQPRLSLDIPCLRRRSTSRSIFFFHLATLLLQAARGQQPATSPYTFHVYEDLVQVPTLVMTPLHASYPDLTPSDFSIQLDSGPAFHPRHTRLQGGDPVAYALLLDVSDADGTDMAKALPSALDRLPPNALQAGDTLSVFAMDCALVRSVKSEAANLFTLKTGIATALAAPNLHRSGSKPRCDSSRRLWDSVATIAANLGTEPGRRVLLVLSDGEDGKSQRSWERARNEASSFGVTVIAIRPALSPGYVDTGEHDHPFRLVTEDVFSLLCGETGGIDLYSTPRTLGQTLNRIIDLLRKRYILEFARPSNSTRGLHAIEVATKDRHAIIRSSGATFPIPDKAQLSDGQTIQTDPSRAPLFGDRKVLKQPQ